MCLSIDETVINGAQIFFNAQFGIQDQPWIVGIVNSAPYLACAVAGCWLSIPLNHYLGRRGTIFVTCLCDVICCICQALVHSKSRKRVPYLDSLHILITFL